MNWDALGATGEIIGAIAVFSTLYYLATQIRIQSREIEKSNEHVRAQLSIDINNMVINNFDGLMRDKEFVKIYQKGISNQPLDEIETVQFSQFVNRWMALCESVVIVTKAEVMFDNDYDLDFLYGNPWVHKLISTEVGARWFEEEAPLIYSKDFLDKVETFKGKAINQS
jgi:hypothetical protein